MSLFRAFITIGILIFIFGTSFILIDAIVRSFTEGLREIGIRFIIMGSITITIAFLYKYHKIVGFLLKQLKNRITDQDRFSKWYKP